ncbi:hypothetical protein D9M69_150230 [compost metagenome]
MAKSPTPVICACRRTISLSSSTPLSAFTTRVPPCTLRSWPLPSTIAPPLVRVTVWVWLVSLISFSTRSEPSVSMLMSPLPETPFTAPSLVTVSSLPSLRLTMFTPALPAEAARRSTWVFTAVRLPMPLLALSSRSGVNSLPPAPWMELPAFRLIDLSLCTVPTTFRFWLALATICLPEATSMSPRPMLPVESRNRSVFSVPPWFTSRRLAVMPSGLSAELSMSLFRS